MALGDEIKQARERAQLTQGELAELVGVTEGTVSNWERGVVRTPKNRLARVWEVLRDHRSPPTDTSGTRDDHHPFDAADLIADLNPHQLSALADALPNDVVVGTIARRLHTEQTTNRVTDRQWPRIELPADEDEPDTGEQPA